MPWTPADVTETELELLRALWRRESATIRELADELYPDGTQSHYATVQSLLDRLQKKDCVARRRDGRVNVYWATVSRAHLMGRRLRDLADAFCDGSMAPLLSHLVERVDLSEDELSTLDAIVERLDPAGSPDSKEA